MKVDKDTVRRKEGNGKVARFRQETKGRWGGTGDKRGQERGSRKRKMKENKETKERSVLMGRSRVEVERTRNSLVL